MSLLSQAALLGVVFMLAGTSLTPAAQAATPYRTAHHGWQGSEGFAAWQLSGVVAQAGTLRFDNATARPGSDPYGAGGYHGRNYYNGGNFLAGEALGPETATAFPFYEAIASWNAETPPGTWIDVELRARVGRRWSRWYSMGVWAADGGSVQRHSVDGQSGANVRVDVDTLKLSTRRTGASALQLRVKLFSADGTAVPSLRSAGVTISTTPSMTNQPRPGNPALWNRALDVPECSQMVYPDGGEVWCSPTSTSMVLGYWRRDGSGCEPRVRHAVSGVFDWMYDGHGNWSFNTAYAGAQGFEAKVTRLSSLADAEPWIAAGVPVIYSISWARGELDGAPGASNGHLSVLVGFDGAGNPVVNDPAASDNSGVRRTYNRAQFERLWLGHSGGTVYLVYPPGHAVPGL